MKSSREKIIDAAIDLICEKSYHGTSIQMIAKKVGITKSTIFHHFENKEAILLAILDLSLPQPMYRLTMLVNDDSLTGREKLKKFIKLQMEVVAKKGDLLSISLREEVYLSEQNAKIHVEGRKHYARLVREIIKQIQREEHNRFAGMSSSIVANAVLGICNWGIRWYKEDGPISLDEVCEQLFRIIDPL
jgi:TetR/AcrR family transcriptional regulator, cholesterol catabolism regulator